MNYLAHSLLSAHHDGLLAGNFIADAVKGNAAGRFPDDIVRGIYMHRAIDEFTDKHPATKEVAAVFRPDYGRYAPVLTDIIFDYLLATGWTAFSEKELPLFADDIYARLAPNRGYFPERMQLFYDNMVRYNFFVGYGEKEGIYQTLKRLQMRANTDLDFTRSMLVAENEKGRLGDLFAEIFFDLQRELQKQGYK